MLQASTDQNTIDISISYLVWVFTFILIHLLGTIAVMSQAAWQVFIILIPITATCIWYQVVFWTMSNQYHMTPLTSEVT